MKHWSRNDKFAFFGVLLAALGIIGAVFPQEIRHLAGLDRDTPPAQSAPAQSVADPPKPAMPPITSSVDPVPSVVPKPTAVLVPVPIPVPTTSPMVPAIPEPVAPRKLEITSLGQDVTITIRAAKSKDEETDGPLLLKGDRRKSTFYLGKGQIATISMTGDKGILFLAPNVRSRVQYTTLGEGTTVRDAPGT